MHCGVALLEMGKVFGAEVLAAHQHPGFNIRVGIHAGGVLLGGGVDAEGTIRCIAVNIAARMEQTAPAGAIRSISDIRCTELVAPRRSVALVHPGPRSWRQRPTAACGSFANRASPLASASRLSTDHG